MNLRIAKKILKNVKAGKCKYTELQIKTAEQKVQNASKKWGATKDIIWGESQLDEWRIHFMDWFSDYTGTWRR